MKKEKDKHGASAAPVLILSFFLPQREPPLLFRFSLHFGKGMPLLFALFLLKLQRLSLIHI